MSLLLRNFHEQNIIQSDDIVALIKLIPKENLKGLKYIVYDPSRFYQRSYVYPVIPNRNVKGEYFSRMLDAIIIYEVKDVATFKHILFHEIGHYVFNRILELKDKKHWVTKLYPEREFISDYARTNAQEDFAESYSFYIQGKKFGYHLQSKFNFLQRVIGSS